MRRWAWFSAALAPVLLIGGWTVAQSRQPAGYDALRDTISALAARGATDAWIMTAGLAGLGACHLITAAGFQTAGRAARAMLALGGAATVVVAASPQPAAAHVPAAVVGFIALAAWPALMRRTLGSYRWWALVLLAFLAWFGIAVAIDSLVGLSERVLAGAESLAPITLFVAISARRPSPETRRADRRPPRA
jgi:hypothetical membrane protein